MAAETSQGGVVDIIGSSMKTKEQEGHAWALLHKVGTRFKEVQHLLGEDEVYHTNQGI